MNLPALVYHADWSTRPANRWAVRAVLDGTTYIASDDDDRFDAFVGLMGMINVIRGRQAPGDPTNQEIRSIEGWMLGQRW